MEGNKNEIHELANDELLPTKAPILIMANKQDLETAMSVDDMINALELSSISNRKWHIQGACAINGEGLYEGLDWLAEQVTGVKAKAEK